MQNNVMKPVTKFSLLIISLIVVSGAQLYMCSSEPSRRAVVDFPLERQTLSTELSELQSEIDQNLEKTGRQIQVSSQDAKDRLVRVNRAFLREKGEVRKALASVNAATEETWSGIKKDAQYTLDDAKRTCYKLEKNIRNAIAKE